MMISAPLYRRILGASWSELEEPIRLMHATCPTVRARGQLRVEHGLHPLTGLAARMLGLPRPTAAADTRLVVTARHEGEQWERTFSGRRFATLQYSWREVLAERFGVLEFRFRLRVSGGSLFYVQQQAAVRYGPVRLPIPSSWAPRVEAREDPAGANRIHVEVRVVLPGIGLLISYAGIIEVEETGR